MKGAHCMRMRAKTLWLALALSLVGGGAVSGAAMATESDAEADTMGSLVEDYSYPGAVTIKAERGIELISGDGNITLLADCTGSTPKIKIETFLPGGEAMYCFAVRGDSGYLKLDVPNVYFIWSGDEPLNAKYTVDGVAGSVDLDANRLKEVGASSPDASVLLELRAG